MSFNVEPPDDNDERLAELFELWEVIHASRGLDALPEFLAANCDNEQELANQFKELLRAAAWGDELTTENEADPKSAQPVPKPWALPGSMVGPYRLLKQLGRGGMGEVWEAEQTNEILRRVAIKFILAAQSTSTTLARFEQERQVLALMNHPNIANVFDAGITEDGHPYFVMELVEEGVPLTEYCDKQRLTLLERLRLFLTVCEAVQHAHQKGIIHRDLKPNNVLVSVTANPPTPKVIDFGVAKSTQLKLTDHSIFTEAGQLIGTLEYMAPEQVDLRNVDIDTRADIYALGVILYELLTGSLPFDRESLLGLGLHEMLRTIREVEPALPSVQVSQTKILSTLAQSRNSDADSMQRQLKGDLDWIVIKCLEKDRSRRYATATSLSEDLQCYLRGDPLLRRSGRRLYWLGKIVRKHRLATAITASLMVFLALSIFVSTLGWRRAAEESRRKNSALLIAEQLAESSARRLYAAKITQAQREWETGLASSAWQHLQNTEKRFRNWEFDYLSSLLEGDCDVLGEHGSPVRSVTISADGKLVASGDSEGKIKLWDLSTGKLALSIDWQNESAKARNVIEQVVFQGKDRIAGLTLDGELSFWDVRTGSRLGKRQDFRSLHCKPVLSSDARRLVSWGQQGGIFLEPQCWEIGNEITNAGELLIGVVSAGDDTPMIQTLSPNGHMLAVADRGGNVVVSHTDGELRRGRFRPHSSVVTALVFNGSGDQLATGHADHTVCIWKMSDGGPPVPAKRDGVFNSPDTSETLSFDLDIELRGINGPVTALAFNSDNTLLAAGSKDQMIRVWDANEGKIVAVFKGHQESVNSVQFTPDGDRLVTGSNDQTVRVWVLPQQKLPPTLYGHNNSIRAIACNPVEPTVASVGNDFTVRFWDLESGGVENWKARSSKIPSHISFSRDGQLFAAIGDVPSRHVRDENWVKYYEIKTKTKFSDFTVLDAHSHTFIVKDSVTGKKLAFSDDGNLAIGRDVIEIRPQRANVAAIVLDASRFAMELSKPTGGSVGPLTTFSYSQDGNRIIAQYLGAGLLIWDVRSGKILRQVNAHNGNTNDVSFSPDGTQFATGGNDHTVAIWNTSSGKRICVGHGHTGAVLCVAFSLDGERLFSGSADGTVKVWDVGNGEQLLTFTGHSGAVNALAVTGDGRAVVSGSEDGTLKVWEADGKIREWRRKHPNSELSPTVP